MLLIQCGFCRAMRIGSRSAPFFWIPTSDRRNGWLSAAHQYLVRVRLRKSFSDLCCLDNPGMRTVPTISLVARDKSRVTDQSAHETGPGRWEGSNAFTVTRDENCNTRRNQYHPFDSQRNQSTAIRKCAGMIS